MQIRLLNLDRSPDRLAAFASRNSGLQNVRRVSAIDGRQADRARLVANGVLTPDLDYSDGALGCALSHLVQWRDAIQNDCPLTIVEDDAVLAGNFETEHQRLVATLPDDWEFVMWGYNFDAFTTFDVLPGYSHLVAAFDQQAMRTRSGQFGTEKIDSRLFRLQAGFGTVCYSISPRGARRLLDFCMPLRPMLAPVPGYALPIPNRGIDNMLLLAWPVMGAYVAVPPLVLTDNDHDISTVQVPRPAAATSAPVAPLPGSAGTCITGAAHLPAITPSAKRNLLILRCGRSSLHRHWLEGATPNWDIVLVPYESVEADGLPCFDAPGQKWHGLCRFFAETSAWRDYDYVCMPDDDILTDAATWNRFFDYCAALDITVAAPALTSESHFTHVITMQNKSFKARETTFVEIMNPCMNQGFLRAAVPTMHLSASGTGFGLDFLWPAMAGYRGCWIIDDTPVVHTRPIGGARNTALAAHANYDRRRVESLGFRQVCNTLAGYGLDGTLITNRHEGFKRLYAQGYDYFRSVHPNRAFELAFLSTQDLPAHSHNTLSRLGQAIEALFRPARPASCGKPSRVSSVSHLSYSADPATEARAGNDGRLTGNFGFRTGEQADPWWQVDLLDDHAIAAIHLFNRLDGIADLVELDILTSLDGHDWILRHRKRDGRLFGGIDGTALAVPFAPAIVARFVRVQAIGTTSLALDQVEVYGDRVATPTTAQRHLLEPAL